MAVKFYKKDGNIIIEGVYADKLSINPTNFDWQILNEVYTVRDGIQKQTYELGVFSNVTDELGVAYASAELLESALNTATNLTTINELLDDPNFATKVALGKIAGVTTISKFGDNPEIDTATLPEDIWSFGGQYIYSTSNDIDTISSSSINDTQEVVVIGQTLAGVEITQSVILNGQTKVTLPTALAIVYRAYNNNGTPTEGLIYIYVDTTIVAGVPTDTTKIRAGFTVEAQQTEMLIYRVPTGKTLVYVEGFFALARKKEGSVTLILQIRKEGGVFLAKRRISLNSNGTGAWNDDYLIPRVLSEKTDIKFRVTDVSDNDIGVSGGFSGLLFDNAIWNL